MHPEALILRRCYPVPVTFADMRAAREVLAAKRRSACSHIAFLMPREVGGYDWHAALKQVTSALDEVYALVDGREVRVAVVRENGVEADCSVTTFGWGYDFRALLEVADEQGYWERPHEVRLDLSPRPVSHGEVARAMLVGQKYVERKVSPMGGKTYFAEYILQHGQRSVDIMRTADVLPVIMVDALERDAVK